MKVTIDTKAESLGISGEKLKEPLPLRVTGKDGECLGDVVNLFDDGEGTMIAHVVVDDLETWERLRKMAETGSLDIRSMIIGDDGPVIVEEDDGEID